MKLQNRRKSIFCLALGVAMLAWAVTPLVAQEGTATGDISIASVSVNKMSLQERLFVCGGKAQAGTPIGALNGTSGTITISGIPATATVHKATLFWSVLTNDDATSLPTSTIGQSIMFDGNAITGTNVGKALEDPCFPQTATIAYKADVTSLVKSVSVTGNGSYAVSGFPVSGGTGSGLDFSEGATLQVVWTDPNGSLMEDVLFHTGTGGLLAVTQADTFSQDLTGFKVNAAGPISATLYEVIGNGQTDGSEVLRFDGPVASDINLDNTLDGSTVAYAAATCPSSPVNPPECFWDDDVHDVSSQMNHGAMSATLAKTTGSDCFDYVALNLAVSTDEDRVCAEGGAYVDAQCPAGAVYKNHGEYVQCVSHAAQEFLAALPWDGTCPRAEIQSCIVNPRARSDVGKPNP